MKYRQNTILLVDDEHDILEFIGYNLKNSGYIVYTATNGRDAIRLANKVKPGLIILDVMMPEMDGIETCRELRKTMLLKNTVIAMLSARGEDYTQIASFEAGADDFIKKPIRPSVLKSRVKALMRRNLAEKAGHPAIIRLKDFVIDRERYVVIKNGKELTLPRKEFELLLSLASKPNKVFSREEILHNIWGSDVVVGDRTIDVHIRKIREKLGENCIRTYQGIGYSYSTKHSNNEVIDQAN